MSPQSNLKPALGQWSTSNKSHDLWAIHLSLWYGHVILVSRYLGLTSVNWSEPWCPTLQVRDKRPTHTQNARTIFTQTRVKKRVPKHVFARIWCAYLLLLFTLITVICVAFCKTKSKTKAVPTDTAKKYLRWETNSRFACCWCTVANHRQMSDFYSNVFLLWTECKRKQS